MTQNDFLEYNDIKIDNKIKFSPSGFNVFYNNPKTWYKNQILKENDFTGNTATVTGSIIHSRLACLWNDIQWDKNIEYNYVAKYDGNSEVDCWKVADDVDRIWNTLSQEFDKIQRPDAIEQEVMFEIPDSDYYIAGTLDYMKTQQSIIGDIKTTSTTPKSIKVGHRIQILLYELARRMNGLEPMKNMEVMYIVKLKTKPKLVVLSEPIKELDIDWVKDEVKAMMKRLDLVKQDKELINVLFFNNADSYL